MRLPPFRIAATALLVAVAYYVGANLGFALRFPAVNPSVLWPPNAILTATLLLAPPRYWWIYVLAVFPAHMLVQLETIRPWSLVLVLFATNWSEALLAAAGVRWLSDAPTRFDTLRRVAVFIISASLVAPFTSSFLDAAAVAALREEPYWLVWRTRFFANALTELSLVPALVMAASSGGVWLRAPLRRLAEWILMALGLVTVGGMALFGVVAAGLEAVLGTLGLPLVFVLPFILWAATRFGPGGASFSLLTTALLATWALMKGPGLLGAVPSADGILALQMFLSALGIPVICLAGLIEERRRAQEVMRERLSFEELLARLSGAFVHVPSHEIDAVIETWLRRLGEFLRLDRVTIRRFSADGQSLVTSHGWTAPGSHSAPAVAACRDLSWTVRQLLQEQPVVVARVSDLPDDATLDREWFQRTGIKAGFILPLVTGRGVFASLALLTAAEDRAWTDELVQRLRLVAEVFSNALSRKEAEDALRASEVMKSAILASLSSSVAVLDNQGRVIAVNDNWTRFGAENGTWDARAALGASYLDACRQAAGDGVGHASEALDGIVAVLERSRPSFALEYGRVGPFGSRWFLMSAVPLNRPEGGAVVSHTDVSEHKRLELDALRSRQELSHFTRVSTMGELTASLAHELNQPLTGILTNAQAARRYLDAIPPDLAEVHAILADIIEDDKRAAEVIRRLRDFLRKGESQQVPVDLNMIIQEVAKLVSSDALIRNVAITLVCDADLPIVVGDRVQLQQVVLNLLVNGMEAMGECPEGERPLVVRTERTDDKRAHVSVRDAGPGLREGTQELVFEPFYTTKPAGMGMGLAIARSIIEAHGGIIWSMNNATRGTTFHFTLPPALGQAA